jgi:hypothetical protein
MGEMYQARDTRLGRNVAVEVVLESWAASRWYGTTTSLLTANNSLASSISHEPKPELKQRVTVK